MFIAFTSDDLSSCVWLALEERQQHWRLIRAVHTSLNCLLKHCVDWSGAKVVRELLHQFSVKMWPIVTVLVHIHAHWKDRKTIKHWNNLTNLNIFEFFQAKGKQTSHIYMRTQLEIRLSWFCYPIYLCKLHLSRCYVCSLQRRGWSSVGSLEAEL